MRKALVSFSLVFLLVRSASANEVTQQIVISDALASGALVAGIVADGNRAQGAATALFVGSSATFVAGPSIAFMRNDEPGKAAASFLLRAALPAAGAWLGQRYADYECALPANRNSPTGGFCRLAVLGPLAPALLAAAVAPYLIMRF